MRLKAEGFQPGCDEHERKNHFAHSAKLAWYLMCMFIAAFLATFGHRNTADHTN
jgi:hypothetical protein